MSEHEIPERDGKKAFGNIKCRKIFRKGWHWCVQNLLTLHWNILNCVVTTVLRIWCTHSDC